MIAAALRRVFTRPGMMLMLTLVALYCLPIALSLTVRDAAMSLLLPVTLLSASLLWTLGFSRVKQVWVWIIVLIVGPIMLFIRVAQIGADLLNVLTQSIDLLPALPSWLIDKVPPDLSLLNIASSDLVDKTLAVWYRLYAWGAGLYYGIRVEDPAARALAWSLGLWFAGAWAGWQVARNGRALAGLIPTTITLALVVNYTGAQKIALWIHLSILLFMLGLTGYESLLRRWEHSRTDYSESIVHDTLMASGALAIILSLAMIFVSTFSLREFMDRFRASAPAGNDSRAQSLGLESQKTGSEVSALGINTLPREHLIEAGPDLTHETIMTVQTGDLPPLPPEAHIEPPRYYWRTLSYEIYTGSGWINPNVAGVEVEPNDILIGTPQINYRVVKQAVISDQPDGRLYWTGMLRDADVPIQIAWRTQAFDPPVNAGGDPFLGADMIGALTSAKTYHVESLIPEIDAQTLRKVNVYYPSWVAERYLQLPDSVPERVLALARDLTASASTPYDRAIAIERYLRQYPYTLDVPAPPIDRDVADYFLFDLKKGYCDYYATSMVVLARAAGLPARFVTGYASGAYDSEHARYVVTASDAHSWVEIYFTRVGWVEFEPTAGQPVIARAEEIEKPEIAPTEPTRSPIWDKAQPYLNVALSYAGWTIAIILVFFLIWIGTDSFRLNLLEPTRAIDRIYGRLRRLTRPVSGFASTNVTAHEYASALTARVSSIGSQSRLRKWLFPAREEINSLTEIYTRSLFSPTAPTKHDIGNALRIWSSLRWRLVLANIHVTLIPSMQKNLPINGEIASSGRTPSSQ